jgi:hypothetical protein
MKLELQGKLTIGKSTQSHGDPFIHIEVTDEKSRINFLRLEISLEEFAQALFSLACRPCTFTLIGTDHVGWTVENKSVWVAYPKGYGSDFIEEMRPLVAPYCVDDWDVSDYDLQFNGHRCKDGKMEVPIFRYVQEPADAKRRK